MQSLQVSDAVAKAAPCPPQWSPLAFFGNEGAASVVRCSPLWVRSATGVYKSGIV